MFGGPAKTYGKVYVLRIGHRPGRDKRITTHVGLVARAFGANGFILGDTCDEVVINSLRKVERIWGGELHVECGVNSIRYAEEWRRRGGEVIHLTMYGVGVDEVIDSIRLSPRPKLIIVGAEKVPREFYEIADYNIAIGNQPHSEVAAIAVFLDKLFAGRELYSKFPGARRIIIPSPRGKKVIEIGDIKGQ